MFLLQYCMCVSWSSPCGINNSRIVYNIVLNALVWNKVSSNWCLLLTTGPKHLIIKQTRIGINIFYEFFITVGYGKIDKWPKSNQFVLIVTKNLAFIMSPVSNNTNVALVLNQLPRKILKSNLLCFCWITYLTYKPTMHAVFRLNRINLNLKILGNLSLYSNKQL